MAPLPQPRSRIPELVYRSYEERANDWDGLGFSMSELGNECDRALWYFVRWAPAKEVFGGKLLRLFQTGHIEEARIVEDLRAIGLDVQDVDPETGKQFIARALSGHVRGKLDGKVLGVPEAPTKVHVLEAKSHNDKSFGKVRTHGVKNAKFEHWVQMQMYMHIHSIDRALYAATNKNTDEVYYERVNYDHEFCARLLARLERILRMPQPPSPISDKRNAPACMFCKAKALCSGESFARVNCRTCIHSTPEFHGDAAWSCARWSKPLLPSEQRDACPAHLFIPALVPGEVLDASEEEEWVLYRLSDGREWRDGREASPAPVLIAIERDDSYRPDAPDA